MSGLNRRAFCVRIIIITIAIRTRQRCSRSIAARRRTWKTRTRGRVPCGRAAENAPGWTRMRRASRRDGRLLFSRASHQGGARDGQRGPTSYGARSEVSKIFFIISSSLSHITITPSYTEGKEVGSNLKDIRFPHAAIGRLTTEQGKNDEKTKRTTRVPRLETNSL